ncbi:patatin-like phospholipase family protein [Sphingomonas paucimobilis]|uniref:patatin-like phospholipase family protein n=1 Tax=Sphingomonas paucimobilis TaxID=13689 RepID=UPI0028D6832F|nr:patatin-like phospholipase family protein [Sphingomonas paucimobilis]
MTLPLPPDLRIAMVLAGGNALGAYQAGVFEALHGAGISPDWVVGTSVGAINGAIIAGNAPSDRLSRLSDLWRPEGTGAITVSAWDDMIDSWRRSGEVIATLLGGRRGLFAPLGTALAEHDAPALYDTTPLAHTLRRLVDFDRLNDGRVRYMAQAVALDTGQEAVFDNARDPIMPHHVRASCAMPPAFSPVAIDGALYVDGGLSANLPLDPVLARPDNAPLLCIAVDLLPLAGPRAPTLGGLISRTQDLVFAAQSRRTLARWQDHYATAPDKAAASVTLVQLRYADQQAEVAGKALDFSPRSVRARWDAGLRDGRALVAALAQGAIPLGGRGLTSTTIAAGQEPLAAHPGAMP